MFLVGIPALMSLSAVGCSGCSGCSGCQAEETFSPIDTGTSEATTKATASVENEDAGAGGSGGAGGSRGAEPQPKKTAPVDPFRISRCCTALRANRGSAPAAQHATYDMAIEACDAAKSNPAMLLQLKKILPRVPAACE